MIDAQKGMSTFKTKIGYILSTLAASLSLIYFACISLPVPSESVFSPAPLLAVYPAFFTQSHLVFMIPSVLFLMWNGYLFRGRKTIPMRTTVGFWLLAGLSLLYLLASIPYGFQYQGVEYTIAVFFINVFIIGILGLIWFLAVKKRRYVINFIFSWLLFVWLSWYAFPYLGEWP